MRPSENTGFSYPKNAILLAPNRQHKVRPALERYTAFPTNTFAAKDVCLVNEDLSLSYPLELILSFWASLNSSTATLHILNKIQLTFCLSKSLFLSASMSHILRALGLTVCFQTHQFRRQRL